MIKQASIVAAVLLLSIGMTGCTSDPIGTRNDAIRDGFGDAVRTDQALQVINPEAGQKEVPTATLDGQKAERALDTYRKDTGKAQSNTRLIQGIGQ